jgi:hypothetical protein
MTSIAKRLLLKVILGRGSFCYAQETATALPSHWLSEAPVRLLQEVLLRWTALKNLREEFGEADPVAVKDE